MMRHEFSLSGPCGLGDAFYMYPIVKWYLDKGFGIELCTDYPVVFSSLKQKPLSFSEHRKDSVSISCPYALRKHRLETNQFNDMCMAAGVPLDIKFEIDFEKQLPVFEEPYALIKPPYFGLGRHRSDLLAPCPIFMQKVIDLISKKFKTVLIKHHDDLPYDFKVDQVFNSSSVLEFIGLVQNSKLVFSQTGHMLAMSESLNIPSIIVYTRKAFNSNDYLVNTILPEKVTVKPLITQSIYDDMPLDSLCF